MNLKNLYRTIYRSYFIDIDRYYRYVYGNIGFLKTKTKKTKLVR